MGVCGDNLQGGASIGNHIGLFAKSSGKIGLGHLSRMRAFAEQLASVQQNFTFFCDSASRAVLHGWGFSQKSIKPFSMGMLDRSITHAVVDLAYHGNSFLPGTLGQMADRFECVVALDSMPPDHISFSNSCFNFDNIVLVTPYLSPERFRPPPPKGVRWLTGVDYSIYNSKHSTATTSDLHAGRERRLLISCGGSDPTELSLELLQRVVGDSLIPVRVIIGPLYRDSTVRKIKDLCNLKPSVQILDGVKDMASEFLWASHVYGRVGITRYEVASLNRHGVYFNESESFQDYYDFLTESDFCRVYSMFDKNLFLDEFSAELRKPSTLSDCEMRTTVFRRDGVQRIIECLLG